MTDAEFQQQLNEICDRTKSGFAALMDMHRAAIATLAAQRVATLSRRSASILNPIRCFCC